MRVFLLKDTLMFQSLGMYATYEGAHAAGKKWLDRHKGFTWEDLEIESWEVED
jgi:hypothetical protein